MARPLESPTPSRAPRGSSRPLPMATSTASGGRKPAAHMASATANPSGMSCRAMAVVSGSPTDMSPWEKLTPMAIPSGRLCRAMAKTNSQTREHCSWPGPQGPVLSCSCGVNWSSPSINSTPRVIPATTTAAAAKPLPVMSLAASSPGSSREKALAASIMPAAKPSMESSTRCGTARRKRAGRAPRAVAAKPAAPPMRP